MSGEISVYKSNISWKWQFKRTEFLGSSAVIIKVELSPSKKIFFFFFLLTPYKNDEKCFLKSFFRSQNIQVFVTNFWSCRKNGLIRKKSLTLKFMMSQPGFLIAQTIAMHILPNISQSKGNQTMKFGQLIEYNKRQNFLQKLCRKWGRETSCRPLLIFWKSLIWGESK